MLLSEGAVEMGKAYSRLAHTDYFSAHAALGNKCRAFFGEACALCLEACNCAACFIRLQFRLLGGKETS